MYNRFDKGMHPKQCVLDHLLGCFSEKLDLEDIASELGNVSDTQQREKRRFGKRKKNNTVLQSWLLVV